MGILTNFAKSVLGLKGKAPQTFGVDPAGALHNQYSSEGSPKIKSVKAGRPEHRKSRKGLPKMLRP